jgi:hypothetical protein
MMDWKVMPRVSVITVTVVVAVVLFFALFAASSGFAQDTPPQDGPPQDNPGPAPSPPKPAGRDYHPFGDDEDVVQPPSTLSPDTAPLTGVLVPGVGTQEMRHSYWVPGFQYGNFVRSISENKPGNWSTLNLVGSNVSLLESWSHSQLNIDYSGGATFSTDKTIGRGYYHQLDLIQAFTWRRWQLSLIDQLSYLPLPQFGFGATSSLAVPGVGGSLGPSSPALQASYQPNQSIFSGFGPNYSNSITTQVVYRVSSRGSLTMSGSYGLLKFVAPGNIDSNDAIISLGYDYAVSKYDTIGLLYRFSAYRYLGEAQAIQDHVAQLAYGRKVTGRMALQLFAGPEFTVFRLQTVGFADRTSVSGGANLIYDLSRTSLSAGYNHGVSGGSGVFTGSNTDSVHGGMSRQLSRVWQGNISFGFARNSTLGNRNVVVSAPTFDALFVGAGVDRALGRTASVSFGYTAYLTEATKLGCPSCTSNLVHQISGSFQWHTRPLVLR